MSTGAAPPAAERAHRIADTAALVACTAFATLYLTKQFVDGDEAVFAAIAQRIRAFDLPAYEAGWDHKPPLLVHLYALLLRPWDGVSVLALRMASALAWVATAWIGGAAARRLAGPWAFAPAVVAYGLLRSIGGTKAGAANAEAFLAPLVAGAAFLFVFARNRRGAAWGAAGALVAVAVLLKPNALVFGLAGIAAVALVRGGREAVRAALAAVCGAALVLVPVVATLAINGTWADAWWLTVEANRIYMESGPSMGIAGHLAALGAAVRETAAPWIFAAVAGAAACLRPAALVGSPPDHGVVNTVLPEAAPRVRRAAFATVLFLAAGYVAVAAGGNYFRHYWWMLHSFLAVACGAGVAATLRLVRPPVLAWGLVALVCAVFWAPAQRTDKRRLRKSFLFDAAAETPYAGPAHLALAAAVKRLTRPGESIWIWGSQPEIYVMTGRPSASRHVTGHLLTGALRMDVRSGAAPPDPDLCPRAWDTLEADLRRHPPALIVDTSGTGYRQWNLFPPERFPRLVRLLDESFVPGETVAGARLWVRRSP